MSQTINEQNFQVIIRVRPLNSKQQEQIQFYEYAQSKKFKTSSKPIKLSPQAYAFYTKFYNVQNLNDIMKVQNSQSINVIDTEYKNVDKKMKQYCFSHVYSQKETSQQIFHESIASQIQGIFQGFNYTILAYGITGSGKTHTVFGNHEKNHKGISGLALTYLLQKKRQLQKDTATRVSLGFSFVEIYNQNVRDLLNTQNKMLNIIEDSKGNTSFTDAIQIQIYNQQQIHDLISIGLAKRSLGATIANQYSSRSHAIIQMNVQILTQTNRIFSKMFIIDLAGSEKIQTLNTAKKMLEGANINKSLLALGNCINILAQSSKRGINGSAVHIPYRDSKLTRILKDSLGGNAKTLMIACVSENPFTIEQTITTLNYALRAQVIKKQLKRNKLYSEDEQKKLCSYCAKEFNGQREAIIKPKIMLPLHLTQLHTDTKQEILSTFFDQIYDDIIQNVKERMSIERVLASQPHTKISIQDIQKLQQVNQNHRIQLKDTMWKLFIQKQQDYYQKLSELNQFVITINSEQDKSERNKKKSIVTLGTVETDQKNSQERYHQNNDSCKRYSTLENYQNTNTNTNQAREGQYQNKRTTSLTRNPLQEKIVNQEYYGSKPLDSIKFITKENQKPAFYSDQNSHVRFSFASLLTSDLTKSQLELQNQQQSSQKKPKRKKNRGKFQIVKRMSASKLNSNSKQPDQVSV